MDLEEIANELNDQNEDVIVTATGEIISKSQTSTNDRGVIDKKTGAPVTQIKPHKWYAWYEDNRTRLVMESDVMQERFPSFALRRKGEELYWVGELKPAKTRSYKIAIVYPGNYPSSAPKAFVIEPSINPTKHIYNDKSLCLMYPGDRTWNPNTTAVQIVSMTAAWLFCYEYHAEHCPTNCSNVPCQYWPGEEKPHNC